MREGEEGREGGEKEGGREDGREGGEKEGGREGGRARRREREGRSQSYCLVMGSTILIMIATSLLLLPGVRHTQ